MNKRTYRGKAAAKRKNTQRHWRVAQRREGSEERVAHQPLTRNHHKLLMISVDTKALILKIGGYVYRGNRNE